MTAGQAGNELPVSFAARLGSDGRGDAGLIAPMHALMRLNVLAILLG